MEKEKLYTEYEVKMMLSYAVAHEKGTAIEMKERVDAILDWHNHPKDN